MEFAVWNYLIREQLQFVSHMDLNKMWKLWIYCYCILNCSKFQFIQLYLYMSLVLGLSINTPQVAITI